MIELFKIWPSKFKVKVMIQGHIVGITSYRLAFPFFHVDWPSRSWDRAISNTDLQNPRSMAWVRSKFKSQCESNILSTHISFVPCQSALPFLRYSSFKIWLWKSKVNVIAQGHKVGITPYRLISLSTVGYHIAFYGANFRHQLIFLTSPAAKRLNRDWTYQMW